MPSCNDVKIAKRKEKVVRTIAPRTCFAVTFRGMKPNNGCLVFIVSRFKQVEGVTQTMPELSVSVTVMLT